MKAKNSSQPATRWWALPPYSALDVESSAKGAGDGKASGVRFIQRRNWKRVELAAFRYELGRRSASAELPSFPDLPAPIQFDVERFMGARITEEDVDMLAAEVAKRPKRPGDPEAPGLLDFLAAKESSPSGEAALPPSLCHGAPEFVRCDFGFDLSASDADLVRGFMWWVRAARARRGTAKRAGADGRGRLPTAKATARKRPVPWEWLDLLDAEGAASGKTESRKRAARKARRESVSWAAVLAEIVRRHGRTK